MWMMLQEDAADDYVIATGVSHSVKRLVEIAFDQAGLHWEQHVRVDPAFLRPAGVDHLVGDSTKAREVLGWEGAGLSSARLAAVLGRARVSAIYTG